MAKHTGTKLYQVFVGCLFRKAIRKNYDRLKTEVEKETPLHLVLADTGAITSTDYLLEHITRLVSESAGCVFDASGGNANVSLEVGIAHALPTDFVLTFNTRKPRTAQERSAEKAATKEGEVRPIIADLQVGPGSNTRRTPTSSESCFGDTSRTSPSCGVGMSSSASTERW